MLLLPHSYLCMSLEARFKSWKRNESKSNQHKTSCQVVLLQRFSVHRRLNYSLRGVEPVGARFTVARFERTGGAEKVDALCIISLLDN